MLTPLSTSTGVPVVELSYRQTLTSRIVKSRRTFPTNAGAPVLVPDSARIGSLTMLVVIRPNAGRTHRRRFHSTPQPRPEPQPGFRDRCSRTSLAPNLRARSDRDGDRIESVRRHREFSASAIDSSYDRLRSASESSACVGHIAVFRARPGGSESEQLHVARDARCDAPI